MSEASSQVEPSRVVVTGGTGYIASWIVQELLARGHHVFASVRNPDASERCGHLLAMGKRLPGTLELFKADLLEGGSFDAAVADADYVVHTASPFTEAKLRNPEEELIKPAVEGTRNVLRAVESSSSVKRVVLTSSVLAVYGNNTDIRDTDGVFTEAHWNESCSASFRSYPFSKVCAERTAWGLAEAQDRWELVVLNPGFVLGPSLTDRVDSQSISFMRDMLAGQFALGMPVWYVPIVDVRTVAQAHVQAVFRKQASGRNIIVADTIRIIEMAVLLREHYGDEFKLPTRELPKVLMYLLGPLVGYSIKTVHENFSVPIAVDNTRSRELLGVEYPPLKQTFVDHAEQMLKSGILRSAGT